MRRNKMKYDFTKIELKDINGEELKAKFHKTIANVVYRFALSVDLVEIAMAINKGKVVELTDSQIKEIADVVKNPQNGIATFARKAFTDFIK